MDNKINIFVSHRIDIKSEVISNDIYKPVRCGAVFDDKNIMEIPGDNIGDNISEKRMSFCEFTVQYWAWKNVEADYYGLCHYRRYLSFSNKRYKTNMYNMVFEPLLSYLSSRKYGFDKEDEIKKQVQNYDVVVSESADVRKIYTPLGYKSSVFELWKAHENNFFEPGIVELVLELIKTLKPDYYESAKEYFAGDRHRGFNCYILKKEIFFDLCSFQFPIMEEVEKMIDTTNYSQTMKRTPAFVGEMLYGIFIYQVLKSKKYKVLEKQLVFFERTEHIETRYKVFLYYVGAGIERILRLIVDPFFPIGSERRELIKNYVFKILPIKKHGMADIKE